MKLINQSFEIINQTDFSLKGIQKFVEKCARVSYKSENRITEDSYEKFVKNLYDRDHMRPFEFGTVHLKFKSEDAFNKFRDAVIRHNLWNNWWIHFNVHEGVYYVSLNYRYYLDIMKNVPNISTYKVDEDNEYYPKRYTVHFIINRVTMDSFRTHIGLSHLAESTRYCNYSKDKFNNEIICVIPPYCKDLTEGNSYDLAICEYGLIQAENLSEKSAIWVESMCQAEQNYMQLLENNNCVPQEARDVLPLSVKSELISCGFKDAWDNFFYRRCANDAHPMARELALPLKESIYK